MEAARRFVGPGARAFRNEAGDLVVLSIDELRELRFDFINLQPHENPHMHVVEYERVKNKKEEVVNERYWPSDLRPI